MTQPTANLLALRDWASPFTSRKSLNLLHHPSWTHIPSTQHNWRQRSDRNHGVSTMACQTCSVSLVHGMRAAISPLRTMKPSYTKVIKSPTRTTLNQSSPIFFLAFIHKVWTQTIQILLAWTSFISLLFICLTSVLIGMKILNTKIFFILRIICKRHPTLAFLCDAW